MLAGRPGATGTRSEGVPTRRAARVTAWLRDRFWLPVGAITLATGLLLLDRLFAWPPHEDETLVFFVSRQGLPDVLDTVADRGGAPLHFLLAHAALQVDESLTAVRALSALFATASIPVTAALAARLADRRVAVLAALLAAASWMLVYHGVYGRMYGLFLFTSALSSLLLLRALKRQDARRWAAWGAASFCMLATQPYGALVLAAQAVWVAAVRISRPFPLRRGILAFAAVVLLAVPLWRTYSHLASRFDVGVGEESGSELGSPLEVLHFLWNVLEDFTAGWDAVAIPAGLVALLGVVVLARRRWEAGLFAVAVVIVPAVALLLPRAASDLSLETRHLIFVLPFFATTLAVGLLELHRRLPRAGLLLLAAAVIGLVAAQVAWGWSKSPWLYAGEPSERETGRAEAAAYLASTGLADDVLFGYEPTYLDAWREGAPFGRVFVPRADAGLALQALREAEPLGRAVWVLDATDELDQSRRRLTIPENSPGAGFEARAFGPFLIIRTRAPVETTEAFLRETIRVERMGQEMEIGDAWRNLSTAETALEALERS
jgi:Dolichyl-phosphate-mannose-protein mannosyltransferase